MVMQFETLALVAGGAVAAHQLVQQAQQVPSIAGVAPHGRVRPASGVPLESA